MRRAFFILFPSLTVAGTLAAAVHGCGADGSSAGSGGISSSGSSASQGSGGPQDGGKDSPHDSPPPDAPIYDGPVQGFCTLPGTYRTTANGVEIVPGGKPGPDLLWLHLPVGYCAHWFGNVGNARQLRFAPGGEL